MAGGEQMQVVDKNKLKGILPIIIWSFSLSLLSAFAVESILWMWISWELPEPFGEIMVPRPRHFSLSTLRLLGALLPTLVAIVALLINAVLFPRVWLLTWSGANLFAFLAKSLYCVSTQLSPHIGAVLVIQTVYTLLPLPGVWIGMIACHFIKRASASRKAVKEKSASD